MVVCSWHDPSWLGPSFLESSWLDPLHVHALFHEVRALFCRSGEPANSATIRLHSGSKGAAGSCSSSLRPHLEVNFLTTVFGYTPGDNPTDCSIHTRTRDEPF